MLNRALAGYTCVEVGDSVAAGWCARIVADLGAEVVKVEPPEGSRLRSAGPFPPGEEDGEAGGFFCYLNTNKLGVTAKLTTPEGTELLDRLLAKAQILIWGADSPGAAGAAEPRVLAERFPHLVVTSVTPFGLVGPYRNHVGNESVVQAISGLLAVTPKITGGTHNEPLKLPGHFGAFFGGLHAALATLGALWSRDEGGVLLDIALVDALMPSYVPVFTQYESDPSLTFSHQTPATGWSIVPCKDGYVLIAGLMDDVWQRLLDAMDRPAWAESEVFSSAVSRTQNWDAALAAMQPWLNEHTREELFGRFQAHGGTSSPVYDMAEALTLDQVKYRQFLVPLDPQRFGEHVLMPGVPFAAGASKEYIVRPAPTLGQDNRMIYCELLGLDEQELADRTLRGVI